MVLGEAHPLRRLSKERRCAGDLLGVIPTHPGIYLRHFSPLWHLVSEGATHNKESKDDPEIQKHTAAWPCCASSATRPHSKATRRALWRGPHHCPAVGVP